MTSPELHADDLLDREARGLLSEEERSRLKSHLTVCSVCRFERAVRADFKAEFEALGAIRPEPEVSAKPELGRSLTTRRRRRVLRIGLIAAALLLGGAAAAKLAGHGVFSFVAPSFGPSGAGAKPPAEEARRNEAKHGAGLARASTALKPDAPEASAAAEGDSSVPPPASAPEAPADLANLAHVRRSAVATEGTSPAVQSMRAADAEQPAEPSSAPTESPAALFEAASAAREQGNYELAVERYETLLQRFPASAQALATPAILGRLQLDRGNAALALAQFDAYLSSGSTTLREEAMVGRALAFGKLGQAVQEAAAWQALLSAYPSSLHAARARQRLSALGAR
jgi:TolA-binding protein